MKKKKKKIYYSRYKKDSNYRANAFARVSLGFLFLYFLSFFSLKHNIIEKRVIVDNKIVYTLRHCADFDVEFCITLYKYNIGTFNNQKLYYAM